MNGHQTASQEASVANQARAKIKFAVRLAVTDLGTLREGDRLNLDADLHEFLGWEPSRKTRAEIQEGTGRLIPIAQESLLWVARANALNDQIGRADDRPFAQYLVPTKGLRFVGFTPGRLPVAGGRLSDAFNFALGDALTRIDPRHVRQCQASDCRRVFFAEHLNRRAFCSARCGNREAARRFREEKAKKRR